jgi:hypothetical protein
MIIKIADWLEDVEPLKLALLNSVEEYSEVRRRYLSQFEYDEEFSVTDLTRPVRQFWLYKRHKQDFVIDLLKDNWHSLMGSIIHFILENYAPKDHLVEERQHCFFNINGKKILFHGCPDLYAIKKKALKDWKFTSAKSMCYEKNDAYEFQLQSNAFLLEGRGYPVEHIENIFCFRDRNKRDAEQYEGYPEENAQRLSYPLWPREKTESEIISRIENLLQYKEAQELPECTEEERWNRTAKWKIKKKKKGNKEWMKKAWKTADTEEEARMIAATADADTEIYYSPGTDVRCEDWCHANRFCSQFHRLCRMREEQKKIDMTLGFGEEE